MKIFEILCVGLTALASCVGQNSGVILSYPKSETSLPHTSKTPEEYRFEIVKGILAAGTPVKAGTIQLHRMGDEAGLDIIRIVSDQAVTTHQVVTIIEMVRKSFERPAAIVNASNRKPGGSLLLLQHLDAIVADPVIKQQIADARQFVLAATGGK